MLARQALRSARLAGNAKTTVGRTTAVSPVRNGPKTRRWKLTTYTIQRASTSSATEAASEISSTPFRLTLAGSAATAVAVGSLAWYYHLFGQDVYAMTPAEEG